MWILNQDMDTLYSTENECKISVCPKNRSVDDGFAVYLIAPNGDMTELGSYFCYDDARDAVFACASCMRGNWLSMPAKDFNISRKANAAEKECQRRRDARDKIINYTVTAILILLTILKLSLG